MTQAEHLLQEVVSNGLQMREKMYKCLIKGSLMAGEKLKAEYWLFQMDVNGFALDKFISGSLMRADARDEDAAGAEQ